MIKKLLISSILIAILPKHAIAADIPTINKPYKSSESGLLATRGSLNGVVDRVNENFTVVSDNLAAAGNAIQTNHEAIVAAHASNAAASASLDHDINAVKSDLNKVGEAIQANHDALANSSGLMDSSYTND
ncbi:hypothetical protein PVK62_00150 [Aliivibrio sp. S3MY1]|uniref:hypothetical protein n=1 Tax=unclassified Aliivibrio TaxID=2645654 RepID=UPI002379F776|nr:MULTISPECIES: hypothetical protein [unclassified Aliivibrio]MDD9194247.1 hypothetical protein [Aliivibrio sp. S3MY1]MDD9197914.1 hypothetical protein [Aliivibrio sp. S2MY1]